jgi:glycosyltransferase involved in cell wall biosynthesis
MERRDWCINGRFLTQKITGVQRYAREIVQGLDELIAERHPLTAGLRVEILMPEAGLALPGLKAIESRVVTGLKGHLWEQIVLPAQAKGKILNLCNTAPVSGRNIVCIHDMNVVEFPASYSLQFRLLYKALIPAVARRAKLVTTVSRYSAEKIAAVGLDSGAIAVLPNGHEHAKAWFPTHSPATEKAAGSRTVVVLGSGAPHKNVAMLRALAGDMAKEGLKLAIVGALDAKVFQAAGLDATTDAISVGRLSDDELAALLGDCLCLAFPSFVEGFGLPPLEAMALGCPVVSSDRASLPEVGGSAVLYADPDRPQEWLKAFLRLRDDPSLRASLIEKGRVQAGQFSWRGSALGYLESMAKIDRS